MTTKRSKRPGGPGKARALPARVLKGDQARRVKGGNIEVNYSTSSAKVLPGVNAVQKVRE